MMTRILASLLFFSVIPFTTTGQGVITLEGEYRGHHLYVQNPFASNDTGFCVTSVVVNGKERVFDQSSAFQIWLDTSEFKLGDKLEVKIFHKKDCTPKVLHTQWGKPKGGFELEWIKINESGLLTWKTKGELNKLPYVIEQYRWNKWIKIGEVEGKGSFKENSYEYQVTDLHSGENKFRIKQVDYTSQPRVSAAVTLTTGFKEITYTVNNEKAVVEFSRPTQYEIHDSYGNVVAKGNGIVAEIPNHQKKAAYYLNYDNLEAQIFIKPEKK